MPLQDLTPELRTRLSRVEKTVGWFVSLAVLLLLAGFVDYGYHTAKRRGWFVTKARYFTYVRTAAGIKVGDPVKLMGFDVGEITMIEAMPADNREHNVYIEFQIRAPYFGYLWTDSQVKVNAGDFLGHRYLEVTKGIYGDPTYRFEHGKLTAIYHAGQYEPITKKSKPYELLSGEEPGLNERLAGVVDQVDAALPNVFGLTNQIAEVLDNSRRLTERLDRAVQTAQPTLANLAHISEQLTNGPGALGRWLVPPTLDQGLQSTLRQADGALASANTNLTSLVSNLNLSLGHLANVTSNLEVQVQANTNILSSISSAIIHADQFVQGLKHHWLLRSAFEHTTKVHPLPPARPKAGKRVAP